MDELIEEKKSKFKVAEITYIDGQSVSSLQQQKKFVPESFQEYKENFIDVPSIIEKNKRLLEEMIDGINQILVDE